MYTLNGTDEPRYTGCQAAADGMKEMSHLEVGITRQSVVRAPMT